MVFNSDVNVPGSPQSTDGSLEVGPIDTSIKSKIPRPLPPDTQVVPPNLNMPGVGLPQLDMPAPRRPMSLEQSLSTAIDPNDPKYKMGIGGRIMGTVANFLNGATGRGPVVNTGRGALNSQYYRDEENRLRQLNDAQTQDKLWRRQQQDFWNLIRRGSQARVPAGDSSSNNNEYEY